MKKKYVNYLSKIMIFFLYSTIESICKLYKKENEYFDAVFLKVIEDEIFLILQ